MGLKIDDVHRWKGMGPAVKNKNLISVCEGRGRQTRWESREE